MGGNIGRLGVGYRITGQTSLKCEVVKLQKSSYRMENGLPKIGKLKFAIYILLAA